MAPRAYPCREYFSEKTTCPGTIHHTTILYMDEEALELQDLLARIARDDSSPPGPRPRVALEARGRFTVAGKEYPSVIAAARAHGIPEATFLSRYYKYGWSLERAATEPVQCDVLLEWNGEKHKLSTWAAMYELSADALRKRLARGWSLQSALCGPTRSTTRSAVGSRLSDRVRRQIVLDAKARPCTDCAGEFHPEAMEFDHTRGVKLFELSKCNGRGLEEIRAEIAKCDVVCANCHRLRTHRRRKIPPG